MANKIISFGPADPSAVSQLERCLETGEDEALGVLCADHHKGYSMPIGGVMASSKVVIPAGVGYDIGCGNAAVQTSIQAKDVDVPKIMDEIWTQISFGIGRTNNQPLKDSAMASLVFDKIDKSPVKQQREMLQLAKDQLGTVGSGNHYVDLFEDKTDGSLWIGVHFGSRGFGHKTATGFLALAAGKEWGDKTDDSMDSVPAAIPLKTPLADDYLEAMCIAGDYASEGRRQVIAKVLEILGYSGTKRWVHNHHNFAWLEHHNGKSLVVVRKGATPAFPGQLGFVGGSMGDDAVIIEGVDSPASRNALYSTVHGAGRVMGRNEAAGKVKVGKRWQCGERSCENHTILTLAGQMFQRGQDGSLPRCPSCGGKLHLNTVTLSSKPGKVDWPTWQQKLKEQGVELRGAGADEAPECYKRLEDVLDFHAGTIKILHTLRPIGVAMAGKDTFDPYKD